MKSPNFTKLGLQRPLLQVTFLSLFLLMFFLQTLKLFVSLGPEEAPTADGGSVVPRHLYSDTRGLTWSDWLLEEISSGRWAQPHRGAFSPPPSDFHMTFKKLPDELDGNRLLSATEDFAWIYHEHGEKIKLAFDKGGDTVKVTNRFPDGTPCRSELKDTGFLADVEQELGQRLNAFPHPTNGLAVYRLSNPNGNLEPAKEWVSELWHIDNFDNDGFKVLVYCSDVDDDNAPFEYQDPPTFVPVIPRNTTNWFPNTRLNYIGPSLRLLGPAGTAIVFKNSNLPHKGNYCRIGIRDVIIFHFVSK